LGIYTVDRDAWIDRFRTSSMTPCVTGEPRAMSGEIQASGKWLLATRSRERVVSVVLVL
jgi:hypothetical protein